MVDYLPMVDQGRSCAEKSLQFVAISAVILFLIASSLLGSLEPNEYGIVQNRLTGVVYEPPKPPPGSNHPPNYNQVGFDPQSGVYRGGIYYLGLLGSFMRFPATWQLIEFSGGVTGISMSNQMGKASGVNPASSVVQTVQESIWGTAPREHKAERGAVATRTGADPSDPDSGGQPIAISCSFEYFLQKDHLFDIYETFGGYELAKQRYILLSYNQVSNTAQKFTPQDFWKKRPEIAETMRVAVNKTLAENGFAEVPLFQILRVDFDVKYEDSITQIQVAEQQKVINEYAQQVEIVRQKILTIQAANDAQIKNITAGGDALSAEIRAGARRQSFALQQAARGGAYLRMKRILQADYSGGGRSDGGSITDASTGSPSSSTSSPTGEELLMQYFRLKAVAASTNAVEGFGNNTNQFESGKLILGMDKLVDE